MSDAFLEHLRGTLAQIEADGLTKRERLIDGPQGGRIRVAGRRDARDGQSLRQQLSRPRRSSRGRSRRRARRSIATASAWPRCASSAARRPCTASSSARSPTISARTTRSCSPPVSTPTAACSSRCSSESDAIISDALNHASIIDGVRLCKAKRYRFANSDMDELETPAEGGRRGRRALQADRHRRRVLDGRLRRQAAGDLRPRRALRRAGDGRRLPRHRPSRRRRARARRR